MGYEAFTGLDGGALHGLALRKVVHRAWHGLEEHIEWCLSLLNSNGFVLVTCLFVTFCARQLHRFFDFSPASLTFKAHYVLSPCCPSPSCRTKATSGLWPTRWTSLLNSASHLTLLGLRAMLWLGRGFFSIWLTVRKPGNEFWSLPVPD